MSRGKIPGLPKVVEAEERTLTIFITYLGQQSTKSVLLAWARRDSKLEEVSNYLHVLTVIVGGFRHEDLLQGLAENAPALSSIVELARHLESALLPPSALPSETCVEALLKWYHEWVLCKALSEG